MSQSETASWPDRRIQDAISGIFAGFGNRSRIAAPRTRSQLLDATEAILDKDGIDGLTITKVAKEAGCSVGSLYHHFQDKQTIIYAVLDRMSPTKCC